MSLKAAPEISAQYISSGTVKVDGVGITHPEFNAKCIQYFNQVINNNILIAQLLDHIPGTNRLLIMKQDESLPVTNLKKFLPFLALVDETSHILPLPFTNQDSSLLLLSRTTFMQTNMKKRITQVKHVSDFDLNIFPSPFTTVVISDINSVNHLEINFNTLDSKIFFLLFCDPNNRISPETQSFFEGLAAKPLQFEVILINDIGTRFNSFLFDETNISSLFELLSVGGIVYPETMNTFLASMHPSLFSKESIPELVARHNQEFAQQDKKINEETVFHYISNTWYFVHKPRPTDMLDYCELLVTDNFFQYNEKRPIMIPSDLQIKLIEALLDHFAFQKSVKDGILCMKSVINDFIEDNPQFADDGKIVQERLAYVIGAPLLYFPVNDPPTKTDDSTSHWDCMQNALFWKFLFVHGEFEKSSRFIIPGKSAKNKMREIELRHQQQNSFLLTLEVCQDFYIEGRLPEQIAELRSISPDLARLIIAKAQSQVIINQKKEDLRVMKEDIVKLPIPQIYHNRVFGSAFSHEGDINPSSFAIVTDLLANDSFRKLLNSLPEGMSNEKKQQLIQTIVCSLKKFIEKEKTAMKVERSILALGDDLPFLKKHFDHLELRHTMTGQRFNTFPFPPELWPFYLIVKIQSPKTYKTMARFFGFPTTESARKKLYEYFDALKIRNGEALCVGQDGVNVDNVKKLLHINWLDDTIQGREATVAIDAINIRQDFSISSHGEVGTTKETFTYEGISEEQKKALDQKLTINDKRELVNDYVKFNRFIKNHSVNCIGSEFVIYVIPTKPGSKPFPIAVISASSGSSTEAIIGHFESVIQIIEADRVLGKEEVDKPWRKITGEAYDGDRAYQKRVDQFASELKQEFSKSLSGDSTSGIDLGLPIAQCSFYTCVKKKRMLIPDLLHLLKCFRYRLLHGDPPEALELADHTVKSLQIPIQIPMTAPEHLIKPEFFKLLNVPPDVLDNRLFSKMVDYLAVDFFSLAALKGREGQEIPMSLLIGMLPLTLLRHSIMEPKLERNRRLNMANLAHSMLLVYSSCYRLTKDEEKGMVKFETLASEVTKLIWPFVKILPDTVQTRRADFRSNLRDSIDALRGLMIPKEEGKALVQSVFKSFEQSCETYEIDPRSFLDYAEDERILAIQNEVLSEVVTAFRNAVWDTFDDEDVKKSQCASQTHTRGAKILALMDSATLNKALALSFTVVVALSRGEPIRLSALGTHILEHFFGHCRRLMCGESSHTRFLEVVRDVVMEDHLYSLIGYDSGPINKRTTISDSGATVLDQLPVEQMTFGQALKMASELWRTVIPKVDTSIPTEVSESRLPPVSPTLLDGEIDTAGLETNQFSITSVDDVFTLVGLPDAKKRSASTRRSKGSPVKGAELTSDQIRNHRVFSQ